MNTKVKYDFCVLDSEEVDFFVLESEIESVLYALGRWGNKRG